MSSKNKKTRKKKPNLLKGAFILMMSLLALTIGVYFVSAAQYRTKFVPGTTVNGTDISDLSIGEIEDRLDNASDAYALTLRFLNDETATITSSEIGLRYSLRSALGTILQTQNRFTWITGFFGSLQDYSLKTDVSYDEEALAGLISGLPQLNPEHATAPADANLAMDNSFRFYIVPEVNGNTLNYDRLLEAVKTALANREPTLNLVTAEGVYEAPAVISTDEALIARRDSINRMLDTTVTYHLSDGTDQVLNDQVTIEWLKINEAGVYVVDEEHIRGKAAEYIASLAAKDDNYGYFRTFSSTWFGTVKLATDDLHGHTLNQAAMAEELAQDLLSGTSNEHGMTYDKMVDVRDPRFGGTYVEVDILNQHVFFYINGELYYDCRCVTGTEGYHSTPSGIFSVISKDRDRVLEGYKEDGSLSYSAHVDYWICFYPHYGLHDASWRDYFGSEVYLYDGSHGCVNLTNKSARTIYEAIDLDTPVIVFRGHDDVVTPTDEISSDTEDRGN